MTTKTSIKHKYNPEVRILVSILVVGELAEKIDIHGCLCPNWYPKPITDLWEGLVVGSEASSSGNKRYIFFAKFYFGESLPSSPPINSGTQKKAYPMKSFDHNYLF